MCTGTDEMFTKFRLGNIYYSRYYAQDEIRYVIPPLPFKISQGCNKRKISNFANIEHVLIEKLTIIYREFCEELKMFISLTFSVWIQNLDYTCYV